MYFTINERHFTINETQMIRQETQVHHKDFKRWKWDPNVQQRTYDHKGLELIKKETVMVDRERREGQKGYCLKADFYLKKEI